MKPIPKDNRRHCLPSLIILAKHAARPGIPWRRAQLHFDMLPGAWLERRIIGLSISSNRSEAAALRVGTARRMRMQQRDH